MFSKSLLVLVALAIAVATAQTYNGVFTTEAILDGNNGNRGLDCIIIRPWAASGPAVRRPYPVIGWFNGWGGGEVKGFNVTSGYLPGLIRWAISGPYVVVVANQWSAQTQDLDKCLAYTVQQGALVGSHYSGLIDKNSVGISGHSQGGGEALELADGRSLGGYTIRSVISMNPYGANWGRMNNNPSRAPLFILGGALDTTTPLASYATYWTNFKARNVGGVNAFTFNGTHNSDAWCIYPDGSTCSTPDAAKVGFSSRIQGLTENWWRRTLVSNRAAGALVKQTVSAFPWTADIQETPAFSLNAKR